MALEKIQGLDWLVKEQNNEDIIAAAVEASSALMSVATDAENITGTSDLVACTPGTMMAALAALAFPIASSSTVLSSGGGIGYATGAGGTVNQGTSRTTTVVLNKLCGNITMFSAAQAADALVTFTLTNSFIAAGDFVLVQHISATNGGAWDFSVVAGAGSATISVRNNSAAEITSATPLRFAVIKAVTA